MRVNTYEVSHTARLPTTVLPLPSGRSSKRLVPRQEIPQLQSTHTPRSNWVVRLGLLARQNWAGRYALHTASGTRSLSWAQRVFLTVTKPGRADVGSSNPRASLCSICIFGKLSLSKLQRDRTHLEDLDVIYSILRAPLSIHRAPFFDNTLDVGNGESRERQVMPGVEDNNVAPALDGFRF